MPGPWKPTVRSSIVAALVATAYCAAYAGDVRTSGGMVVASDYEQGRDEPLDMKQVSLFTEYRFGGVFAGLLFAPIREVDRILRPDVWGHYRP